MKKVGIFFLIIIALAGIGLFSAYQWYTNISTQPASSNSDRVSFTVEEGDNLNSIAPRLEQSGLIQNELALRIYVRLNNLPANIKVGEYSLPKNLTFTEIIALLEKGVFKPEVKVTLREALRPDQAAETIATEIAKLDQEVAFREEDYLDISENPSNYSFDADVQEFLETYKPADKPLIGFLFPDTYGLNEDTTALQFINTQIRTLILRLEQQGIPASDFTTPETLTFYETLKLAAIIDKEAAGADDRQLISSVFHNRLAVNMPLQSDATINFITRRDDPRSTIAETQIDNPYNLYKFAGLTPTPINSPGVLSIYAAIYPKESEYFYFRHDREAQIYFSRTFEEHQLSIIQNP